VAWTTWTFKEYKNEVDKFGKALISVGFERFDIINIIGFNAPEWFFANFGAIAAGGVAAGIYSTNNAEACQYISKHSKAKVVVCEGLQQLEKYVQIHGDLPDLKALVVYGVDVEIPTYMLDTVSTPIYRYEHFIKLGVIVSDDVLKQRTNSWKPGETCTLIYTSGTTGPPKAVMITHDNITWTVQAMLDRTPKRYLNNSDIMISYLPLSHIAAQMLGT
jgi:long-chain-fatty-acid--CoA ligase ACSBG